MHWLWFGYITMQCNQIIMQVLITNNFFSARKPNIYNIFMISYYAQPFVQNMILVAFLVYLLRILSNICWIWQLAVERYVQQRDWLTQKRQTKTSLYVAVPSGKSLRSFKVLYHPGTRHSYHRVILRLNDKHIFHSVAPVTDHFF